MDEIVPLNKHPKSDDKHHPHLDEIVLIKFDETNHPHLDDFSSPSSYIGSNHHKSSKIVKLTHKNIQFWMKQRGPLLESEHTSSRNLLQKECSCMAVFTARGKVLNLDPNYKCICVYSMRLTVKCRSNTYRQKKQRAQPIEYQLSSTLNATWTDCDED